MVALAHQRSIPTGPLLPAAAGPRPAGTLGDVPVDPRTPVLVGVGQVTARPDGAVPFEQRAEPVELMVRALRAAADDCGPSAGRRLLERAQSIRVMLPLSWGYANPGLLAANKLGIEPQEQALSVIGGNNPQTVASATAGSIARGDLDVVLIAGAECIYSRIAARSAPEQPRFTWTVQPHDTPAPVALGVDRSPLTDAEGAAGLGAPVHVYPLFENALRAAAGNSIDGHQERIAQLWSNFSHVAAANRHAWSNRAYSAEELRTVDADNRMVAFPYPKRLNANDRVDQGAALIMCSAETAQAVGERSDRWVFPLSGTDATDHWFLSERAALSSSPAIAIAGHRALALAGVGTDDVSHIDLYSCFPCAVEMAAEALGLAIDDPDRPLTVTGGLAFFGGPGNNYVTHSIATMAERLRADPGALGLITGVGWYATKHAVGVWSSAPGRGGFRYDSPQGEVDATPVRSPANGTKGPVTIETYTVIYSREGSIERAIFALLTDDGRRCWGSSAETDALDALTTQEGCGRVVHRGAGGEVHL
jgi:acetyl-CoA C-acetyltransferase